MSARTIAPEGALGALWTPLGAHGALGLNSTVPSARIERERGRKEGGWGACAPCAPSCPTPRGAQRVAVREFSERVSGSLPTGDAAFGDLWASHSARPDLFTGALWEVAMCGAESVVAIDAALPEGVIVRPEEALVEAGWFGLGARASARAHGTGVTETPRTPKPPTENRRQPPATRRELTR